MLQYLQAAELIFYSPTPLRHSCADIWTLHIFFFASIMTEKNRDNREISKPLWKWVRHPSCKVTPRKSRVSSFCIPALSCFSVLANAHSDKKKKKRKKSQMSLHALAEKTAYKIKKILGGALTKSLWSSPAFSWKVIITILCSWGCRRHASRQMFACTSG